MRISFIVLVTIVLLFSCNNSTEQADTIIEKPELVFPVTINVDEARSKQEIPLLSNFSDDVRYIKLKTPPNTFIRRIDDVQIHKGKIFILENLSKVMVFDIEGNFIGQIGKTGRGPSEYIFLFSFAYDENSDDLLFYAESKYVSRYDSNGDFIEKLFRFQTTDFMYLFNNKFVFTGSAVQGKGSQLGGMIKIGVTDKTGDTIDLAFLTLYQSRNWEENFFYFTDNYPATRFNGNLLLYWPQEDTIFQVNASGKIESRYLFDFGRYNFPVENRYTNVSKETRNLYVNPNSSPFETPNNLWCKFTLRNEAFILRYDKIKKEAFTFYYKGEKEVNFNTRIEELGLINDIDGGADFFPQWSVYDDSTQLFIAAKSVFNMKSELTQEYFINREIKFPDKKDSLVKLVNSFDDTDDYVLMLVKLK